MNLKDRKENRSKQGCNMNKIRAAKQSKTQLIHNQNMNQNKQNKQMNYYLILFNEGVARMNPITCKEQQTETRQPTHTRTEEGRLTKKNQKRASTTANNDENAITWLSEMKSRRG